MTINLEPDELQAAVTDSLSALCRQHCPDSVARGDPAVFPSELWGALAEFGLFALGTPDGMGGAVELAGAADVLGFAIAPGPLAGTVFAAQVLPADLRDPVIAGEQIVSLTHPPLIPWPKTASLFLETDGDEAWLLEPPGDIEPLATLGGEPWGRGELRRVRPLDSAVRARAVQDVFVAGYMAGAARKLLRDAAEYAANRRQFGKTLSEFQGVTHPLAEAAIRRRAATTLTLFAAHRLDVGEPGAEAAAAGARLSAEAAALQAVYVAHQSYGAMGMTVDGPVFYISRRIRQLANDRSGSWPRLRAIESGYLTGDLPQLHAALG